MMCHHNREPCTYLNCAATYERDWLLAEAPDDIRAAFYAIRQMEADRLHALDPIPHTTTTIPVITDYRL